MAGYLEGDDPSPSVWQEFYNDDLLPLGSVHTVYSMGIQLDTIKYQLLKRIIR